MTSPLDSLYLITQRQRDCFGSYAWVGPDKLKHGERTLIASFIAEEVDGQDVQVFCTASPAQQYTLVVKPRPADALVAHDRPGCEINITIGEDLAGAIANAISSGTMDIAFLKSTQWT